MFQYIKSLFSKKDVVKEEVVMTGRGISDPEIVEIKSSLDSFISERKIYVDFREGAIKTDEGDVLFSLHQDHDLFIDIQYCRLTLRDLNNERLRYHQYYNKLMSDRTLYEKEKQMYGQKFIDDTYNRICQIDKEKPEFMEIMNETIIYRYWNLYCENANCPEVELNQVIWESCQIAN